MLTKTATTTQLVAKSLRSQQCAVPLFISSRNSLLIQATCWSCGRSCSFGDFVMSSKVEEMLVESTLLVPNLISLCTENNMTWILECCEDPCIEKSSNECKRSHGFAVPRVRVTACLLFN